MYPDTVPPEIDKIPFRNALIIENDFNDVDDLAYSLTKRGMSVVMVRNTTVAEEILRKRPEINLIVLDWWLDSDDPMEAEVFLEKLDDIGFALVVIYTNQPSDGIMDCVKRLNRDRIVTVLEKSKIDCDKVFDAVQQWLSNNPELKILLAWSFETESRLNDSLWEMYVLDQEGVQRVVDAIKSKDEASYIPEEYDLIDLLTKVLSRKLGKSIEFRSRIRALLESMRSVQVGPATEQSLERISKIRSFERYVKPPVAEPIWTGDVLRVSTGEYLVVVTPVCDLCNPGKIENILMVKAVAFGEYRKNNLKNDEKAKEYIRNKKESTHYLPYLGEPSMGLLCLFDCLLSKDFDELQKQLKNGEFVRVATIDSPFVENLMQRMNAYLMRFGVRDLRSEEIEMIVEKTRPPKNKGKVSIALTEQRKEGK